jgi:diguanylate cyclase (GGDEF)-like protein
MTPTTLTPDPLTGLAGFDGFRARMGELLRRARQGKHPFALGLFDLDGFGRVNEAHGREVGDGVIRRLAEYLAEAIGAAGELFRYGGDAIGVLLPETEKEGAFLLLERARAGFGSERVVGIDGGQADFKVSVSCGVAAAPNDGADAENLLRKLQAALYRAKVQGPGRTCLAREEKMVTKTSHYTQGQLEGLTRLAKRLEKGEAVLLREALDDLLRKYNA